MENLQRNDAMLMELLNEKQSIDGFLEAIFGFLARRTDFYMEMKQPTDTMGFLPGINEQIVLQSMRKWRTLIKADQQIPVATEVEIGPSETAEDEITTTVDDSTLIEYTPSPTSNEIAPLHDVHQYQKYHHHHRRHLESKDTFQQSDYHNGANYDNYCWSQTFREIEILVRLPSNIMSSRNLSVNVEQNSINICEKINPINVLLEGTLLRPCKHTNVVWTTSENILHITLDKKMECWWDKLLTSEPAIDRKLLNCTQPIDELPEETQATIARAQWDAEQKQQGRLTSEEIEQHRLLRRAWNAEGSPFQGTAFAPDTVKFN